ncbi:hypothetical protein PAXRUDRAFT_21026 [Paxillus rubicundulus Ve08.2h10]|uniref:Uncharacterized protein n=1 Tax=Paxillus rubicundulus Ve08.2h10 TaxID=930991 RepID=A0A0D0D0D3_9AGAM|nr:hypothetical protein PAXRUDRAFT_21026 [Paxillus rubicundulus Ve08.2h10]
MHHLLALAATTTTTHTQPQYLPNQVMLGTVTEKVGTSLTIKILPRPTPLNRQVLPSPPASIHS